MAVVDRIVFTEPMMTAFAAASHDVNPLHTDPNYAARTPFGYPVVYGVLGLLAALRNVLRTMPICITHLQADFVRPLHLGELDVMAPPVQKKVPPSNGTEALIAELWRMQVGEVDIGREDSFFDVGGHSLMTVEFLNRLKERTGVRLRVRDIVFEDLQGIAALVERAASSGEKKGLLSRLFG